MFDRFTEEARRVMGFARQEAERLGHDTIRTVHVLLGLVSEWADVSADVRTELSMDLSKIRAEVESLTAKGAASPTRSQMTFTPQAKSILDGAVEEAGLLGHTHIGTEHLLLALLSTREAITAYVLGHLAPSLSEVRGRIVKIRRSDPPGGSLVPAV